MSSIEPKKIDEALLDVDWVIAMHEELNNFTRYQVCELVERPRDHNVIETRWAFRNKQDQDGIVVRNKARLVAQGYTQVEGLDFGETYAPFARLEVSAQKMCQCAGHTASQKDLLRMITEFRLASIVGPVDPANSSRGVPVNLTYN